MVHYTFEEYGDMIMCYGEARSNSYEAQRIYRERYPLRQVPNVRTFIDVHRRSREDGCFRKPKLNSGVSRTRRTVRNEETVLRMVENNPKTSTRKTSSASRRIFAPLTTIYFRRFTFPKRFFFTSTAILSLYLRNELRLSENSATTVYHVFIMICYILPILGAICADSGMGRYRTVFYFSVIYLVGNIIMVFAAIPATDFSPILMTVIGLTLISVGTGGSKPCLAAFGGDQFRLPQQRDQLQQFFSLFYFSINLGGFVGMIITPIMRKSVTCFGDDTCYALGFGFPALLILLSILIFIMGQHWYRMKSPKENIVLQFVKCTCYALYRSIRKGNHKEYWLDKARDKFDSKLVTDMKVVFAVLLLYTPLPLFWSLFDQQGRHKAATNFINTLPCDIVIHSPFAPVLTLNSSGRFVFGDIIAHGSTIYNVTITTDSNICGSILLTKKGYALKVLAVEYQTDTILIGVNKWNEISDYITDPVDYRVSLNERPRVRIDFITTSDALKNVSVSLKSMTGLIDTYYLELHHQQNVLAARGAKRVHLISHEYAENATIVACANALGQAIPPAILFKGKSMKPTYSDEYTSPSPLTLVFDGTKYQLDISIAEKSENHGINFYCLPSNTTHELQPMDKSVFRSYEAYWNDEFIKYWDKHPIRDLSMMICPYDKDILPFEAFAPSLLTERPNPNNEFHNEILAETDYDSDDYIPLAMVRQKLLKIMENSFSEVLPTPILVKKKSAPRRKAINYKAVEVKRSVSFFNDEQSPVTSKTALASSSTANCEPQPASLTTVRYECIVSSNEIPILDKHFIHLALGGVYALVIRERKGKIEVTVQQEVLPFVPADSFHPPLSMLIEFEYESRTVQFPSATNARFNFHKANYNQLYRDLANTDWSHLELNQAVEKFYETFFLICKQSVPLYRTTSRSYPPWFTATVISALKAKEYHRRKWKLTKSPFYASEFKRYRIICKDQISLAYNCYAEKVGQSLRNNPRELFKFINQKQGKTRIPCSLIHNNITLYSPKDIVNAFADNFLETQTIGSGYDLPDVFSNRLPFDLSAVSDDEAFEFFFFAILIVADMMLFVLMAARYKFVQLEADSSVAMLEDTPLLSHASMLQAKPSYK
ncbi:oligopeptide transporter-related [Holotrichia oblita]|uniref:Oligopeptide transporter-related n=1 Tax=Holotrichia oblita TaxID=644536 RepID=A0ACB9TZ51_HOLOL|nr:oligopeptide transporter-related [Holotrichia oblita]